MANKIKISKEQADFIRNTYGMQKCFISGEEFSFQDVVYIQKEEDLGTDIFEVKRLVDLPKGDKKAILKNILTTTK